MTGRVVSFEDRIDRLVTRRKWIAQRRAELNEQQKACTKEMNDLYDEDRQLERAEETYKKYIDK